MREHVPTVSIREPNVSSGKTLGILAGQTDREGVIQMSEDELATRRALQESLDLRDQGHTDA
jgi:hypothetical protein